MFPNQNGRYNLKMESKMVRPFEKKLENGTFHFYENGRVPVPLKTFHFQNGRVNCNALWKWNVHFQFGDTIENGMYQNGKYKMEWLELNFCQTIRVTIKYHSIFLLFGDTCKLAFHFSKIGMQFPVYLNFPQQRRVASTPSPAFLFTILWILKLLIPSFHNGTFQWVEKGRRDSYLHNYWCWQLS